MELVALEIMHLNKSGGGATAVAQRITWHFALRILFLEVMCHTSSCQEKPTQIVRKIVQRQLARSIMGT